jgi:hypothetical protein
MLKPPGTKRLKLNKDTLLSSIAFKFHLRRYDAAGKPPDNKDGLKRVGTD